MANRHQQISLPEVGQVWGEVIWQTGPLALGRNGLTLEEMNSFLAQRVEFLDSVVHDPLNRDIIQMYRDINAKIAQRQARRAAAGVLGTLDTVPGDVAETDSDEGHAGPQPE